MKTGQRNYKFPLDLYFFRRICGFFNNRVSISNNVVPNGGRVHRTTGYERPEEVKAVPLQAWSGPEGSRKLRFPDFMTPSQDGGKVVSLTHRPPLPPGNTPGTHFR